MPGILYILATPIGNLEDITLRALRLLKEVDGIIAEDTRRTLKLLSHFGIQKRLISYFEYSKQKKAESIVALLQEGQNLALVSDAGTPTLSDPGARLIALARSQGISVVPIPGPSAMLAALSVSGFPTDPLHFWGFLPLKNSKRRRVYELMVTLKGTHCLYESPHKLLKHLEEWKNYFSDYHLLVAKELTKQYETFWHGSFLDVHEALKQVEIRGEYTVILSKEKF